MNKQIYIDFAFISGELGIEKDALLELLNIYISEMSQLMLNVKELLMKQDFTGLQHSIHSIKGVSANLFIQPMYEIAAAIDSRLKTLDLENINDDIEVLFSTFAAAENEIQSILKLNGFIAEAPEA